jgi:Zn-dependent alcohol dehydrogenase
LAPSVRAGAPTCQDRRLVHGWQARHRRPDHAPLQFEDINQGFELMKRGESIRSVVIY